ncbi:MAG TPA: ABC transporter substrate-binding protein, partial [Methylovirgula sp.]
MITAFCLGFLLAGGGVAQAADTLRIAAQKTGTFSWELDVIKDHGLDKKAGIDLDVTELATTEA